MLPVFWESTQLVHEIGLSLFGFLLLSKNSAILFLFITHKVSYSMYLENSSEGLCYAEENLNQQMKMLYGDYCESPWLLQTVNLLSKHFGQSAT